MPIHLHSPGLLTERREKGPEKNTETGDREVSFTKGSSPVHTAEQFDIGGKPV